MSLSDCIIASGSGVFGAISAVAAVQGSFTVLNNKIQAAVVGPPEIQPTVVIATRTAPFGATTAVAIVATITAGTVLFTAEDAGGAVVAADVGGFNYLILNNNVSTSYCG